MRAYVVGTMLIYSKGIRRDIRQRYACERFPLADESLAHKHTLVTYTINLQQWHCADTLFGICMSESGSCLARLHTKEARVAAAKQGPADCLRHQWLEVICLA